MAWIVDSRGIASKVKNASLSTPSPTKDSGASITCPKCSYSIDNNTHDVVPWPGLPKGVKFDPTDEEIIQHLESICGIGYSKPHLLIQEFIPPITHDVGINYTHPKNLPGANKDGVSAFFYHKMVEAYGTGHRKRRKITPSDEEPVRWHKTGRTKPVMINGVQRGCKKIMVLYKSARKGSKPEKSNWVLHQYLLGTQENDELGEYVISKVTYQQQKGDEVETIEVQGGPTTPNTNTPRKVVDGGVIGDEQFFDDTKMFDSYTDVSNHKDNPEDEKNMVYNLSEGNLTCSESIETWSLWENEVLHNHHSLETIGEIDGFAISDADNVDLGTPPDILSLASEESLLNWIGWL